MGPETRSDGEPTLLAGRSRSCSSYRFHLAVATPIHHPRIAAASRVTLDRIASRRSCTHGTCRRRTSLPLRRGCMRLSRRPATTRIDSTRKRARRTDSSRRRCNGSVRSTRRTSARPGCNAESPRHIRPDRRRCRSARTPQVHRRRRASSRARKGYTGRCRRIHRRRPHTPHRPPWPKRSTRLTRTRRPGIHCPVEGNPLAHCMRCLHQTTHRRRRYRIPTRTLPRAQPQRGQTALAEDWPSGRRGGGTNNGFHFAIHDSLHTFERFNHRPRRW